MKSNEIIIYTDGSALGNPGPGGYGAILMYGEHKREISGGFQHTTNNRMELIAVIEALRILKKDGFLITVYSDSQYLVKAVEHGWLNKWMKTNFKGGKKNSDLWRQYFTLSKKHTIKFVWVKGHAENPYNNRCDELANQAARLNNLLIDEGYVGEEENDNTDGKLF